MCPRALKLDETDGDDSSLDVKERDRETLTERERRGGRKRLDDGLPAAGPDKRQGPRY